MTTQQPAGSLALDLDAIVVDESLLGRFLRWLTGFMSESDPLPPRVTAGDCTGWSARSVVEFYDRSRHASTQTGETSGEILEATLKGLAPATRASLNQWKPAHDVGIYLRATLLPFAKEKAATIGKMTAAGILIGLGGLLGTLLPDFDILALGIGGHRNFLLHSALPVWGLYKIHKWAVHRLKPKPGSAADLCCAAAGLFIGGVALGASTHLFVDATLQGHKAVLFPLLGSMVGGSLLDDNLWLGGSSLIALYVAFREFEYVLGADHPLIATARQFAERGREQVHAIGMWTIKLVHRMSLMVADLQKVFAMRFMDAPR